MWPPLQILILELVDTFVGTITLLALDSLENVVRVDKCVRCWLIYQRIDLLNRFEVFILYILAIMHTVPAMLCLVVFGNRAPIQYKNVVLPV